MTAPSDAEQLGLAVLARLLEASLDGIGISDGEGRFVYANPAACAILGYRLEQLLGRHFQMVLAPDERQASLERHARHATSTGGAGDAGDRASAVVRRPDGEEREIENSAIAFEAGGRTLVASIFRDVTEARRQAREAAALARVAASLTFDQPMEATLDALAASVVGATRAVACGVGLIDEEHRYRLAGTCGHPAGFKAASEAAWRAGAGLSSVRAARARRAVVLRDIRRAALADPRWAPVHPFVREAAWDTVVSVPLVYRGRVAGTLTGHYLPEHGPDEEEIAFLGAIADHAAVAVENARLFAEARDKAALEERQRIARELHDSVSQALYGIGLAASAVRTWLDSDPSQAIEPAEYVAELAEAGLAEMRALIFALRPESLAEEGLVAALEKLAAALRARHGIAVRATLDGEPDLSIVQKEALYRVAQEALHNTVKHAAARAVDLRLACEADGVRLELRDDGAGFDPSGSFPGHLGLRSMRERAAQAGGTVELESSPGGGTCVRLTIPSHRDP